MMDYPDRADILINKWTSAKWVNEVCSKKRLLYNLHNAKEHIKASGYVIVVEGYFDVFRLVNGGIKNVVAICSARMTHVHAAILSRYTSHIVVLLDGDEAGQKGAAIAAQVAQDCGMTHHRFTLPPGMDPDDLEDKNIPHLKTIFEQSGMSHDQITEIKLA
jgi:DNA primase